MVNQILIRPKWQLAILSGGLIGLSYPPLHLGFLAWFGFLPLIHIVLNSKPFEAAKYSYLSSITANIISLNWIGNNSGAGFWVVLASLIGAVLYLGVFWAGFGSVSSWFHNRTKTGMILFPFLWVLMEWIRSIGSMGFPWINLALTQSQFLPVLQSMDYTGGYGVSFILIVLNLGFYYTIISKTAIKHLIFTVGFFALIWSYGLLRIQHIESISDSREFSVAIVQPNIDPNEKWEREHRKKTYSIMHTLLDSALLLNPDLVIWPETALPTYLRLSSSSRKPLVQRIEKYGIPLITGTVDIKRDSISNRQYYNSTMLLRPDGTYEMYHKIQLVPFAEYIPLSGYFPSLKKLNFGQGNFHHGSEFTLFETDSVHFSNVICYESSLPNVVRGFVNNGARLITIQANDGWLGNTAGPYQHFELARLRAIENRVPVARSANTGISGIILPTGRVTNKVPLNKTEVIQGSIPIHEEISYYAKNGDWFVLFSTLIVLTLILSSIFRRQLTQ